MTTEGAENSGLLAKPAVESDSRQGLIHMGPIVLSELLEVCSRFLIAQLSTDDKEHCIPRRAPLA